MLSGLSLLLFSCVIFSAAAIKSSLGFAFSIFAMMFLPSLFETYAQAVAVSSLLSCLTSVIVAARGFRSIRWKVLLPCVAGCFLTSPIAIALSSRLQKDLLIKLLGAFMVPSRDIFHFFRRKIQSTPVPYKRPAYRFSLGLYKRTFRRRRPAAGYLFSLLPRQ